MTVSDMALPSGSHPRASDSPRALTRARASVAITGSDVKVPAWAVRAASTVTTDARNAWFMTAAPPSLKDWLSGRKSAAQRVPDNSRPLRAVAAITYWGLGLPLIAGSIVLFSAGALLRWTADTTARRLTALAIILAVLATALL